jgi:hypothetical protein
MRIQGSSPVFGQSSIRGLSRLLRILGQGVEEWL